MKWYLKFVWATSSQLKMRWYWICRQQAYRQKRQRSLKKIHLYAVMSGCLKLLPFMVQMRQERAALSRLFALVWEWYSHLIITMRIRYLPLLRSNSEALASQVHSSFASSLKVSNMNILLNSIKLRYWKRHFTIIRMAVVHWYFPVMKQRDPTKRISMNSARWFAALWMLLPIHPKKRFSCHAPVRWIEIQQKMFFDISMSVLFWIISDIIRSLSSACWMRTKNSSLMCCELLIATLSKSTAGTRIKYFRLQWLTLQTIKYCR